MVHSRLRKDPVTQHWIIFSPEREPASRSAWHSDSANVSTDECPFCPGHEGKTSPEIYVEREPGSLRNQPGWWVRVVPDRYPILHIEGGLEKSAEGMYDSMNAIGAHEMLIETPAHDQHWAEMEPLQLERVVRAYQQRSLDLRNDQRFRHVIWVNNHAAATSPMTTPTTIKMMPDARFMFDVPPSVMLGLSVHPRDHHHRHHRR